ncbi:MAG: hypothetical protein RI894_398, partial [Bacteroidota bacterium]
MANKIIPFRRWRPLLFAILSLAMICTTGLVLFVIRPPDMSWLKEGGMWLFFVAMFWFFYHNVRLIWRSYRRNIGLEIDAEGMTAYTLRPAINTKVYWNDIENIAVVEQSLFLSSIEQLHIR